MDSFSERGIRYYFTKKSYKGPIALFLVPLPGCLILGCITSLIFNNESFFMLKVPLFFLLAAIVWAICKACVRVPDDKEMDELLQEKIKKANINPIDKLNLDEDEIKEVEPIITLNCGHEGLKKVGDDGKLRADNYDYIAMYFTDEEIHYYSCHISLFDTKYVELTDVIFYKDIINPTIVNTGDMSALMFGLVSGRNIEIFFEDSAQCNRSLTALKQKIREKKNE